MYSFSFFNLVMRIWPSFLLSYVSFLLRSVPWLSFVGVEHTRCGLRFNKVMVANHVFRMSGFSSHLGISSKWAENSPQSCVHGSCRVRRRSSLFRTSEPSDSELEPRRKRGHRMSEHSGPLGVERVSGFGREMVAWGMAPRRGWRGHPLGKKEGKDGILIIVRLWIKE